MRASLLLFVAGCAFHPAAATGGGTDGGPGPTADGAPPRDGPLIDAPDAAGSDAGSGSSCTMHALPPNLDVDPSAWSAMFLTAPIWTCTGAGTTTIDSQTGAITNGCSTGDDQTNDVAQAGGGMVLVIRLRGLSVTGDHVVKLVGDKPVVFLVAGDVTVDGGGRIDASATGATPGPGALDAATCGTGAGGAGTVSGWGGGGGAFGTTGGNGGYNASNGGTSNGPAGLTPLRGGCPGGSTPGSSMAGAGGGAFEISASGTIAIGATGTGILAAGGGGAPATTGGGNGGGAGGGILLVSPAAATFGTGGIARAHGGAGSSGNNASSGGGANLPGEDGHATDDTAATDTSGTPGQGSTFGNDDGRIGALTSYSASGPASAAAGLQTRTTNGRGGGGGGGGRIVVTTGTATPACD